MVTELNQAELAALPDEALLEYMLWQDMQCTCHMDTHCFACTHEGHPDQLRETYFNGAD